MSKRDQFEAIKPCFLSMWISRNRAQHYMKKDWPLREELVPCKERNVIKWIWPSGGQRQNNLPTAAHQAQLNQAVHQGSGQGRWLLHLLVPGFSRIDHAEVESWLLWRSSDLAAHQRSRVWKLNERSGTGSVEGICSGCEELSWQQLGQKLRKTGQ